MVELLDSAEWIGVPVVTLGELETGFALGNRRQRNRDLLSAFLGNTVVEIIAMDHSTARHYAELIVALKKVGRPLPTNDLWIGAASLRTDSEVLTYDAHFERMPGVRKRLLRAR